MNDDKYIKEREESVELDFTVVRLIEDVRSIRGPLNTGLTVAS